jgi:peptide/nickel transport system permease protein
LRRNPVAIGGAVIVGLFITVAALATWIAPYSGDALPGRAEIRPTFIPGPSSEYILGLDRYGGDLFSKLVWGARASLLIGVLSTLLGLAGGVLLGLIAGAFPGWIDTLVMRIVDLMLSVPSLLLAVSIAALVGQSPTAIIVAIGVVQVPIFARLLRGSMLAQRDRDYVLASRSLGLSRRTVTMSHVLPNSLGPVIVQATLTLAVAVIEAAALSFLGLGGGEPTTAEWGRMLTSAQNELEVAPRLAFWPGGLIVVTALGFTLLGESLREALDPRSRKQ